MQLRKGITTDWNTLPKNQQTSIFLQSKEWLKFQEDRKHKIFAYQCVDGSRVLGQIGWIMRDLHGRFSYLFAPRGPVIDPTLTATDYLEVASWLITESLKDCKLPIIFARVEPQVDLCLESQFVLLKHKLKVEQTAPVHPEDTQLLDLQKSEEQVLSSMHPKTRYNIRLAEKKGVTVHKGNSYMAHFLQLSHETAERDNFSVHEDIHYSTLIQSLPSDMIDVYAAQYKNEIIAANIVIHFGNSTTYLHGASSSYHREVMAPHLLQWQQIRDAKKRGSAYYDFWGIAPTNRKSKKALSWAGITRFKKGFGGNEVNYVGTYDLKCRPLWYRLYRVARQLQRL